ncbi:MAG: LysE family translocator [Alphaproteobacteria bacterium]
MTPELYLPYLLASALVLVVPGPTILLVMAQALTGGRKVALASVLGVGLGDLLAITVALAGLGALLASSAAAFTAVKWAGALWLVWMGIRMWRKPAQGQDPDRTGGTARIDSPSRVFRDSFVVTALNPKAIGFFIAFLPHFIPPAPTFADYALLASGFVLLGMLNAAAYALGAARLSHKLGSPIWQKRLNRIGGGCLIGAGGLTASLQRSV